MDSATKNSRQQRIRLKGCDDGVHKMRVGKVDQVNGIVFGTDPIFIRAGQGKAVPRGLSNVEHNMDDQPMLKFKSNDPYATFTEVTRRATAAKEMQAALKAQIAAKKTVADLDRVVDEDDGLYEVQQEAAKTGTKQMSRRGTANSRLSSGPRSAISSHRTSNQPINNGPTSSEYSSVKVAGRRAMAAKELKTALEAQLQAKARLDLLGDTHATGTDNYRHGMQSKTAGSAAANLVCSADPLVYTACLEQAQSDLNLTRFQALVHPRNDAEYKDLDTDDLPGVPTSWQKRVKGGTCRPSPRSMNPTSASGSTYNSSRRNVRASGGLDSACSAASAATDARTLAMRSSATASPRPAFPSDTSTSEQTLIRFRSDHNFTTTAEMEAKAANASRLRADLDAQIAEKQARVAHLRSPEMHTPRRGPRSLNPPAQRAQHTPPRPSVSHASREEPVESYFKTAPLSNQCSAALSVEDSYVDSHGHGGHNDADSVGSLVEMDSLNRATHAPLGEVLVPVATQEKAAGKENVFLAWEKAHEVAAAERKRRVHRHVLLAEEDAGTVVTGLPPSNGPKCSTDSDKVACGGLPNSDPSATSLSSQVADPLGDDAGAFPVGEGARTSGPDRAVDAVRPRKGLLCCILSL